MTASSIDKYSKIHYDINGNPIEATINLKNVEMRKFYESMLEDFKDLMAIKESMKKDDGSRFKLNFENETFSFEEIKV